MALKIKSVHVYPKLHTQSFDIEWEVEDYIGSATFYVERSYDGTSFETISPPLVDIYYFSDPDKLIYHVDSKYIYRVRAEYNGETYYSEPSWWADRIYPEVRHIAKEDRIYLERFINDPVKIFILRRYGKRCGHCYDEIKGRKIRQDCPVCFGTSYEGGYYGPFDSFWQRGLRPEVQVLDDRTLLRTQRDNTAWTFATPKLRPDDLIYCIKEGVLYKVNNIVTPLFRGVPIRQHILQMGALTVGSPEYRVLEVL